MFNSAEEVRQHVELVTNQERLEETIEYIDACVKNAKQGLMAWEQVGMGNMTRMARDRWATFTETMRLLTLMREELANEVVQEFLDDVREQMG